MQRLIAAILAVFFLGLAGLMASVTLFVRDPIPIVGARAPLAVTTGETAGEGLRATLVVDGSFRFEVTGEGARDATPGVLLQRGAGGSGDVIAEVHSAGPGVFRGRGQFTAPGRWTLVIDDTGTRSEFPFILQE